MKIQAKEIKIGMIIRRDYWTVEVERIVEGFLKNGKKTYTIGGKGVMKYTGIKKTRDYDSVEFTFKENTKVDVV